MLLSTVEDRLRDRGGRLGHVADHVADIRERAARDRVSIVAAGLAYYIALSVIPALVATVAVYSWLRTPADLFQRIETWSSSLPDEVQRLLAGQLLEVAGQTGTGAGVSFAGSILATFWAASKASRAMMTSLNIAYDVDTDRRALRRRGVAVGVVISAVVLSAVGLALVDTGGNAGDTWWPTVSRLLFWPSLVGVAAGVAALSYRFAPSRETEHIGPILPGVLVSTGVFTVATVALAVYASLADLSRAYGALAAIVGAGIWLLVVCWGLLIGAYVNVEVEERDGGR